MPNIRVAAADRDVPCRMRVAMMPAVFERLLLQRLQESRRTVRTNRYAGDNKEKEVPMIRKLKVRNHERGLLFREGDLIAALQPGTHWKFDPLLKLRFDVVSTRKVWLEHKDIDLIVRSGLIGDDALVLNLKDT